MSVQRTSAFIALLVGGIALGFGPILVRVSDVGPEASAFWRLTLAAPLLWWWALARHRRETLSAIVRPRVALLAGLFFAVDLGLWHWSILHTSVANSTLLSNFAPIFVTLGGWLLFRQRVSRWFLFGMIVALGGAMLLAVPDLNGADVQLVGDAMALAAAVFYAGYMLAIKRARAATSTLVLMALTTSVSALTLLPAALISPQPMIPGDAQAWTIVFALAIVAQLLGQGLITYAFAHLSATLSSVSLLIQPVVAAVLAWIFFSEALSFWQFVGAGLVMTGIFVVRRFGG